VHDLQQLDRELDVTDAAASALDLDELLAALPDVLLEPNLRPADVVDRGRLEPVRVHERLDALHERPPELEVAGCGAGLDHGLALPGGRLAFVVGEGRVQGSGQCRAAASRPQRRIHLERDAVLRRLGQQPHQSACVVRLVDVHQQQVDVGRVVQLASAPLAERDHGEARRARGGDARVRDVADLADDVVDRGAGEVASRDAQHRPPPEAPKTLRDPAPLDVVGELRVEGGTIARGRIPDRRGLVRMAGQEVRRRGREAEQADDGGVLDHRPRLPNPLEGDAREVGIGRVDDREPVGHEPIRRSIHRASTKTGTAIASSAAPPAAALRSAA
jgi:hypothetical protein